MALGATLFTFLAAPGTWITARWVAPNCQILAPDVAPLWHYTCRCFILTIVVSDTLPNHLGSLYDLFDWLMITSVKYDLWGESEVLIRNQFNQRVLKKQELSTESYQRLQTLAWSTRHLNIKQTRQRWKVNIPLSHLAAPCIHKGSTYVTHVLQPGVSSYLV